jgi:hypothetical protein
MTTADSTLDRILKRREKLERKGVFKKQIANSSVTIHPWKVDENGYVSQIGQHEGPGIAMFVIPSGKFLTVESRLIKPELTQQWLTGFANLEELPDMPMQMSPLVDAPFPLFPPPVIERVPDATIGTEGDPNTHEHPPAVRPDEIDREAVLLDLGKLRKERGSKSKSKPQSFTEQARRRNEEMAAQFERDRLAQQERESRPTQRMVMPPPIAEWK